MQNINKILETLSLAASDNREDTLKSIVTASLAKKDSPLNYENLLQEIESEFGLQLYEIELKQSIGNLIDEGRIILLNNEYSLSDDYKTSLKTLEFSLRSKDTIRYNSFKNFIEQKYSDLSKDDLKSVWQLFREYFYECFYYYGVKANQFLNPKYDVNTENVFTNSDILLELFNKCERPEVKEILRYAVDNFSNYATKEDIDFLDELGQKTLAFTSLGLDPELAKNSFDIKLIDWTLFLDTNFLYSVLDLHSNVEDDSCKELLKLIQSNPDYIKIDFKYTELTMAELRSRKNDFNFLDKSLSATAISALLKSDDLDDISRKFYTNLYHNRESTLHPSEVIDLSNLTLPQLNIGLYRTGPIVDKLEDGYMSVRVQEYHRYINDLNLTRAQFSKDPGTKPFKEIYRSDLNVQHDITLREIIRFRRHSIQKKEKKSTTLNEAKYFGITLDELLLKYDSYETKKSSPPEYPVFFRPSYLLNKLIKVLPVKTQDYKKAFIKAVSARGFNKDIRKSKDIIRIVAYLKNQGIDNEEVILNLISEQVFLEKFKEESGKDDFDMGAFIESELNVLFKKTNEDLKNAKETLELATKGKEEEQNLNSKLSYKVDELTNRLNLYVTEANKFKKRLNSYEKNEIKERRNLSTQAFMDFVTKDKDEQIEELKEKLNKSETELLSISEIQLRQQIQKATSVWRRSAWIAFSIVFLLSLVFYVYILYINGWDIKAAIAYLKEDSILGLVSAFIILTVNLICTKLLYDKYHNHSNIKAFEERTKIKIENKDS